MLLQIHDELILECLEKEVKCVIMNNAKLGERKNMNLQEVKSFIRKASKEDINEISDQLNDIIKERREKAKAQFSVGDLVKINTPVISKINPPIFDTRSIFFLKFFENIKNFCIK